MVMVLAPDKRAKQSAAARAAARRRRPRAGDGGEPADTGQSGEPGGSGEQRRIARRGAGSGHRATAGPAARKERDMPKMKTDRGAAKRFKVTGTGRSAGARPTGPTCSRRSRSVRTRRLGREVDVAPADRREVRRLLGR